MPVGGCIASRGISPRMVRCALSAPERLLSCSRLVDKLVETLLVIKGYWRLAFAQNSPIQLRSFVEHRL
jgi:hypothetical protein